MNNLDTIVALAIGESARRSGAKTMVFDWDKAARMIRERGATHASAGLSSDWEYTGGSILTDGKPNLDDYTYLASCWAKPEVCIDGEFIECFILEDEVPANWTGEHSIRKWPESALQILRSTMFSANNSD